LATAESLSTPAVECAKVPVSPTTSETAAPRIACWNRRNLDPQSALMIAAVAYLPNRRSVRYEACGVELPTPSACYEAMEAPPAWMESHDHATHLP
jgi:hypothetical protein